MTPRLETDRLVLRPPDLGDAQALLDAYASDPEVTRYLRWAPKTRPEEVRDFLRTALAAADDGGELLWVLERRDRPSPFGVISAWFSQHGAEVGFALSRGSWGQGYMTEAAGAVVEWLMEQPEIFRVWAYCDCENHASARVLEKLGFEREGRLRRWTVHPNLSDEPRDAFVFARVR